MKALGKPAPRNADAFEYSCDSSDRFQNRAIRHAKNLQ